MMSAQNKVLQVYVLPNGQHMLEQPVHKSPKNQQHQQDHKKNPKPKKKNSIPGIVFSY